MLQTFISYYAGSDQYFDNSVCLCVCLFVFVGISSELHVSERHQIYVLLWRRCGTLCTSRLMDDVTFAHNMQHGACRPRCSE